MALDSIHGPLAGRQMGSRVGALFYWTSPTGGGHPSHTQPLQVSKGEGSYPSDLISEPRSVAKATLRDRIQPSGRRIGLPASADCD